MVNVLNTPEQIKAFQLHATIKALELEIKTGLRHSRGSVLKAAQQNFGVRAKTKKAALKELKKMVS